MKSIGSTVSVNILGQDSVGKMHVNTKIKRLSMGLPSQYKALADRPMSITTQNLAYGTERLKLKRGDRKQMSPSYVSD